MNIYELNHHLINKKNRKKNSSISIIKNIKFDDFIETKDFFETKILEKSLDKGWNTLHYACLNSNIHILKEVIKLYIKNNLNLEECILYSKQSCQIGDFPLNIVIKNNMFNHYLLLLENNLTKYNYTKFDLNKNKLIKVDDDVQKIMNNLPHPNNIITHSLNSSFNKTFFIDFYRLNYDEKTLFSLQFVANLDYLFQFIHIKKVENIIKKVVSGISNINEDEFKIDTQTILLAHTCIKNNCWDYKFESLYKKYITQNSPQELYNNNDVLNTLYNFISNQKNMTELKQMLDTTIKYINIHKSFNIIKKVNKI
jgi:hypothetical protein